MIDNDKNGRVIVKYGMDPPKIISEKDLSDKIESEKDLSESEHEKYLSENEKDLSKKVKVIKTSVKK